jgi:GTP-binding protein Era
MTPPSPTRCGFIAVIGAPNAGKSTLVNRMVGARVAIVTPKVQTTRQRILGITTEGASQFIFIDTPGIFAAKARFEKAMVGAAHASTKEADVVLVIVDAFKGITKDVEQALASVRDVTAPKALVLNKVDKTPKEKLLTLTQELFAHEGFAECFMISALKGDGTESIRRWLHSVLPEDAWHYPEDHMTDMPLRQLAAEITRESLFFRLNQELPYSVAVETESYAEKRDGSVAIRQVIIVQNEGQKKIVIGHKGAMLKDIGASARERIQKLTGGTVHLFLFVKTVEDWKDRKEFYTSIGLEY